MGRQQEAERCAAEERQRDLDAERARQQQLNDEWVQQWAEQARQAADRQ